MTTNSRQLVGPRFKEVRRYKKMTLEEFYGPITRHVNNFSPIENGVRKIGRRLAKEVTDHHHINEHWLYTGIGNMFLEEEGNNIEVAGHSNQQDGVPFFNVSRTEISGGSFDLLKEKAEYYVNFRPFNDCDAYLPVYGDSMHPKYAGGEIIAIREILHKHIIQWGEAYLILANEKANYLNTVKLLFPHESTDLIILRAANPEYKGDTVIERSAISRLFIVKGKITRNQL